MDDKKDITDYIDINISGKQRDKANLTLAPFVAGFLQQIIASICFKSAAKSLQERIRHLSFLVHLACRFEKFEAVIENYNIVKNDMDKGLTDWEDDNYFRTWEQGILTEIFFTDHLQNYDLQQHSVSEPKIEVDDNSNYEAIQQEQSPNSQLDDEDYVPENELKIKIPAKKRLKKSFVHEFRNEFSSKRKPIAKNASFSHRKSFNCNSCEFSSKLKKRYDKHMFEKHEQTLCSICGLNFDTFDSFTIHVEAHMPEKCEICNKSFKNKDVLKKHMDSTHNKIAKEMCPICGKIYKNVGNHVRLVHEYMDKNCPHCKYSCKTFTDLNRHIQRIHTEETVTTCTHCGKRTKDIKRHLKINKCDRPKEERVVALIKCDRCDKTFSSKEHIKRHIKRIHDKILDIHCSQCDYKTYSNFNMRIHVTRVHEGKQLKQNCPYCQQTVISLDWHIKMYHVEKAKVNGKLEEERQKQKCVDTLLVGVNGN